MPAKPAPLQWQPFWRVGVSGWGPGAPQHLHVDRGGGRGGGGRGGSADDDPLREPRPRAGLGEGAGNGSPGCRGKMVGNRDGWMEMEMSRFGLEYYVLLNGDYFPEFSSEIG